MLDLAGEEYAQTLLRQSVRYCLDVEQRMHEALPAVREQVRVEVAHADEALAGRPRERLRRADSHEERAREKGLQLHWHAEIPAALHVRADRQRLQQVLNNLLDNAIKFTAQGGVELRVRWADERLRFEIQDTGRGIAPDRQAHIFRRFEHADVQTNRAYGGTGLGLTLCERLVHLQGGEIGVHSQPGQGALFWFEVPLAVVQPESPAVQTEVLPEQEPLQILLVDDNAVNLMVAQLQLRKLWPAASIDRTSVV